MWTYLSDGFELWNSHPQILLSIIVPKFLPVYCEWFAQCEILLVSICHDDCIGSKVVDIFICILPGHLTSLGAQQQTSHVEPEENPWIGDTGVSTLCDQSEISLVCKVRVFIQSIRIVTVFQHSKELVCHRVDKYPVGQCRGFHPH